jgi:hypothetical protein
MTKRIKHSKTLYTTRDCPYEHEILNRVKRPRCDDEEFYEKWLMEIEEKENIGCAVYCVCTSKDPYYCKCASIVQ